jgi:D-serine dehydratase
MPDVYVISIEANIYVDDIEWMLLNEGMIIVEDSYSILAEKVITNFWIQ